MSFKYFLINKPYGVISQFTKEGNHQTLADLYEFPKDVYPVGRLDTDSEGLLILTNDKSLNHALLSPSKKHERTYWVQLEGAISDEAIAKLCKGVSITIDGKKHITLPAKAELLFPQNITERNPPIRFRKNSPTSWISLTLHEGKNRQVRRMTAAVGFPTLRLIRVAIKDITLESLNKKSVVEIDGKELYALLKITSK